MMADEKISRLPIRIFVPDFLSLKGYTNRFLKFMSEGVSIFISFWFYEEPGLNLL
jgi:hypothetical protein